MKKFSFSEKRKQKPARVENNRLGLLNLNTDSKHNKNSENDLDRYDAVDLNDLNDLNDDLPSDSERKNKKYGDTRSPTPAFPSYIQHLFNSVDPASSANPTPSFPTSFSQKKNSFSKEEFPWSPPAKTNNHQKPKQKTQFQQEVYHREGNNPFSRLFDYQKEVEAKEKEEQRLTEQENAKQEKWKVFAGSYQNGSNKKRKNNFSAARQQEAWRKRAFR